MSLPLSIVIITKNAKDTLGSCLRSVVAISDDIVVVDDFSVDETKLICEKYNVRFYLHHEYDLGKQKQYAINKAKREWILSLDADEVVSKELEKEILDVIVNKKKRFTGYTVPFRNHLFGRLLKYGGENYKMMRLFKKDHVTIKPSLIHEKFILKRGETGLLKNPIHHLSYRNLFQLYSKFTSYAVREARQKYLAGESVNLKKIFLYPPHMFYARYIKDKGYKDGLIRIVLDIGFAYMEFLTYILLTYFISASLFKKPKHRLPI